MGSESVPRLIIYMQEILLRKKLFVKERVTRLVREV